MIFFWAPHRIWRTEITSDAGREGVGAQRGGAEEAQEAGAERSEAGAPPLPAPATAREGEQGVALRGNSETSYVAARFLFLQNLKALDVGRHQR